MKTILFIALTVLLFVVSAQADDAININGYGKAIWGMSEDEVLKAEQGRVIKFDKPAKYLNSTAPIGIDEINVGTDKFKVYYLFDDKSRKLEQVNLAGLEENNELINARTFTTILKLLTEKYGPPTFIKANSNASWKLSRTLINLTHQYIRQMMTQVVISYKPLQSSIDNSKDL
ncbi:MAG: hypothetical protein GJV46_16510 [Geobacter sp.]|nr:hypothetical protein [Geobacter sp.]